MTGAVESDAMTTYDVALADDCYRWSCSTFAAWTVLMLAFQRDALAERGVESIVFTLMGLLQTVMSYLGDVVYLKRGAKGEQFYPDVVLATGLIGWACRLHGSEPAFRRCASCYGTGLMFNLAFAKYKRRTQRRQ